MLTVDINNLDFFGIDMAFSCFDPAVRISSDGFTACLTSSQSKGAVIKSKSVNCSKYEELWEDKPKVKDRQTIERDCCSFHFHIGCVNVVEGKLQATDYETSASRWQVNASYKGETKRNLITCVKEHLALDNLLIPDWTSNFLKITVCIRSRIF